MLLVVDDDPDFLGTAERLLNTGRGVFLAGNAEQAKYLVGTVGDAFSVALVDLDMPVEDGFALIAEMHRDYPGLPVIAISGVLQSFVLESAKYLGAFDALQKPITPEWLDTIARARSRATD